MEAHSLRSTRSGSTPPPGAHPWEHTPSGAHPWEHIPREHIPSDKALQQGAVLQSYKLQA